MPDAPNKRKKDFSIQKFVKLCLYNITKLKMQIPRSKNKCNKLTHIELMYSK